MRRWLALAVTVSILLARAGVAMGQAQPWPVDGRLVLGYGAAYEAAGVSRVHRGADILAAAGSRVLSPAAAVVAFAGRVPVEDGTDRLAVSLDLPDGLRVTLLPLTDVSVTAGQRLAPGDPVGLLAAEGDPSYAEPHLHVGLRRGDTYLDPATLFVGVAAASPPPPAQESVPRGPEPRDDGGPPPSPPAQMSSSAARAADPAAVAAPAATPGRVPSPMPDADPALDAEPSECAGGARAAETPTGATRVDAPKAAAVVTALVAAVLCVGAVRRRSAIERA